MANTAALVETLKRELRARRITYAAIARHLGLSEVSVKRMFSRKELSLSRLDGICALAGIEFSDLARLVTTETAVISQLTPEQEREFVDNEKLMLVALCALNHWGYEQILKVYDIAPAECVKLLARLDKLKFVELMPNNRIRLLVSRAFTWIPDGPIQRFFKTRMQTDFFRSEFDGENELLLLANGALSRKSIAALMVRLRRAMSEFAEMRNDDAALPAAERQPITLLLAARPWESAFFARYRRQQEPRQAQPRRM
jgi:transcriptional regulator with XRE-family HTH domain